MPLRRTFLILALAAAGVLVAASTSPARAAAKRSSAPTAGVSSSPDLPEALVSRSRGLPASGPDGAWGGPRTDERQGAAAPSLPSKTRATSVLIEAQVLEKYRSFRESLSAP